jgi:thiol-disulfide isomerase/thioredoxin
MSPSRGVFAMACALAVALTVVLPRAQNRGIQPDRDHPILAIGSPAPDFTLPGVDGKVHRLSEYAAGKVLAIVFESNHCPTSQLYEGRIEKLYEDYRSKGVTLVAINPNNPAAIRLDELGYTDVTDSLAEMKIRAAYRHIRWPYLYDGETQAVAIKFGVVATPHIYIFDQARKLQYQGRIDDNQREDLVKSQDARKAIDALLAGAPVPIAQTGAFGCTTKWLSKATGVEEEQAKIKAAPVALDLVGADGLKKLRANGTAKVQLVHFWSTGCGACASQFPDLETTYRMYRERAFDFVTVSTNRPVEKPAVLAFLKQQYASNANKLFDADDPGSVQAAWGRKWKLESPFTVALAPDGKVLYEKEGKLDIIDMRRVILANLPDTRAYVGQQAYWAAAVAPSKK